MQRITRKPRAQCPHLAKDILQEAKIALLNAFRRFDPAKSNGAQFRSFAYKKTTGRIANFLQAEWRQTANCLSLDKLLQNTETAENILQDKPPPKPLDPGLLALLPSKQAAEAIRLRFEESQNLDNIGKRLGVSEAWASKLINKALKNKAFRKALLGRLPKDN